MKDRLPEVIAQIGIIHKELIKNNTIFDLEEVYEILNKCEEDVKEHYLGLLMQYYFQQNSLDNFQTLLLEGFKFDLRFEDIKEAFLHTNNNDSVIDFFNDQVVLLKDIVVDEYLIEMYDYYMKNENLQEHLKSSLLLLQNNRYICAFCYKHQEEDYSSLFLNQDLLESLKRDLPYLLK